MKNAIIWLLIIGISSVGAMPRFNLIETDYGYSVDLKIPEPNFQEMVVQCTSTDGLYINETFTKIEISGFAENSEFGDPGIVSSSFDIALEDTSLLLDIRKVITHTMKINNRLYPTQVPQTFCEEVQPNNFRYNKAHYTQSHVQNDIVTIERMYTYRDQKIATISVNPLKYDPTTNTVTYIKSITIDLIMQKPSMVYNGGSPTFDKIMRSMFVNFQDGIGDKIHSQQCREKEKYLIICSENYKNNENLKKLIEVRQKDFQVELISINEISGKTKDDFRKYIRDKKPAFCLLVGTQSDFPYHTYKGMLTIKSYVYYSSSTTTGRPKQDLALGLMFIKNENDLENIINKILVTENTVQTYPKTFLAHGGNQQDFGPGFPPKHTDEIPKEMYEKYFKPKGYKVIEAFAVLEPKGKKEKDIQAFNEGVLFMNYNGHGNVTGWDYGWGIKDLGSITNTKVFPFVLSLACLTGTFDKDDCMAVRSLRHKTGPCAFIGSYESSTVGQHLLNQGYFEALMSKNITRNGAAYAYGSNNDVLPECVKNGTISNGLKELTSWQFHLHGDPGLDCFGTNNTSIETSSFLQRNDVSFNAFLHNKTILCSIKGLHNKKSIDIRLVTLSGKIVYSQIFSNNTVVSPDLFVFVRNTESLKLSSGIYLITVIVNKEISNYNKIMLY